MSAARPRKQRVPRRPLFSRPSRPELRPVAEILRTETAGGVLLLVAAVIALAWANSPWRAGYVALREYVPWPGGHRLGYDLDLAHWAADGLLAIFFFVVGLELKREFVTGALRNISVAIIPVVAAVGGMVAPALIFLGVNAGLEGGSTRGWAVPTATDIAFALAVLAVIGAALPSGLRVFLLTLAVVDDLLAILVIALFFTDDFHAVPLALAVVPLAGFALLVQRHHVWPALLVPLAAATWTLVLASGVHPTVAGVALGATVPVRTREPDAVGLAEHLEHVWRPVSAGIAVPVFAFFAAGVSVPLGSLFDLLGDPVALGVVLGLVVGKLVGVFGSTWLLATFTRAELDEELAWSDIAGVALLAGIGFTVSLLIGGLAYGGSERVDTVTVAVLAGSLLSAVLAAAVLRRRSAVYRRLS